MILARNCVIGLSLGVAALAPAHEGDHKTVQQLYQQAAFSPDVGDARAGEVVAAILSLAPALHNEQGGPLLPAGVKVEEAIWVGSILNVRLEIPALPDGWSLSPIDLETIFRALASPFLHDSTFAGVRIDARVANEAAYRPLHEVASPAPAQPETPPVDSPDDVTPAATPGVGQSIGGPASNAAGQPAGALTGVTVFMSAGHGWTAGEDSDWFLQRPNLLGMIEDYGNIDQLNYFAAFAFNAGATVVPLRPVGWQPIEIVLDQDDPGVTYTGAWTDSFNAQHYENGVTNSGVSYRFTTAAGAESATARFTPSIAQSDFYPVYCYAIASSNRVRQTYRVAHSGGVSDVTVDHRNVGNGWVWLGNYYLESGGANYVEITNEAPDSGAVLADAIRFGGGFGDITRPGPGQTSGYPRDEECQRYWAESEWGNNAAGFSSTIWDQPGSTDLSDNVGAGARMAREMNQVPAGGVLVDRWKRIHLEFHTNASTGAARGQITLITTTGETTNQEAYAITLSDEVDNDMLIIDDEFEHTWVDRASPTFTSAFGAISTGNNSDEFDATIVELAFHDNPQDAELLRDIRIRQAMARACVHGIIRFLHGLPGSEVPLAFAPDTPRDVRVEDLGGGDVRIAWTAPLSDGARGDAATGFVIYQSGNGLGFGDPIVLGNVLEATVSDVPVGEPRYYRVAARNAGGESMPSEVLAVRRPASGAARVLIVNGYDRLRRQINSTQSFTQPPGYAGQSFERQMWREVNSFDYIIEHAEALAAGGIGFASTSNDAIIDSLVDLQDYDIAVWMLGRESTQDATFSSLERSRATTFLQNGGALFASGSEIAFDLINQGSGAAFAQNTLRIGFGADDAGTYNVTPAASGILDGVGAFDFDPAGAPYDAATPDRLTLGTDAQACLNYVGGTGGIAGVQFTGAIYNTVVFGFPFETITSASVRADVMQRVIEFLETATGPLPFDFDRDGDVDFADFQIYAFCAQGPDVDYPGGNFCLEMDGDGDSDVDLADFELFQLGFTGPNP